jgi:hypothetical protein
MGLSACGEEETATPPASAAPTAIETPASAAPTETETPASATPTETPSAGDAAAAALVRERCTAGCHELRVIKEKSESASQWAAIVEAMIAEGASLTAEEKQTVISYLAKTYGE